MSFIDRFFAKFFAKKVGEDNFGNSYYLSSCKNYLGKNKRIVIYKGLNLSSKVPPIWHAWLHYMEDKIPESKNENKKNFLWQKSYKPNLTGTKYVDHRSKLASTKLTDAKNIYNSWKPK